MAKPKVRISSAGAKALLSSAGVLADISERADAIAASACAKTSPDEMRNDPFMAEASVEGRAVGRVWAASPHGNNAQNKNGVLLKSIDAGR